MFESTLAAQGLDHRSRTLMAFYAALLAHFGVLAAVGAASFLDVHMPKDPELPVIFYIPEAIPVADFWRPPAPPQPPPPKGGGEASHAIALPPPQIVIPRATPENTLPPAPTAPESETSLGNDDAGPDGGNGSRNGVSGGTGVDSGGDGVGQGPPGPVAITAEMAPPLLLRKVDPTYPAAARLARMSGRVTIEAVIGLDGSVEAAAIMGSTSPLFDDAALDAVRQWRYRPATMNGSPVRVYLRVVVDFVLR